MKLYDVCGIGNSLVDILVEVSEAEFQSFSLEKGTMRLVDITEQKNILSKLKNDDPRLVSGGSVANSMIAFSQLGGKGAFIGVVGDDRYGLHYKSEIDALGIDMGSPNVVGETTGTCLSLVTPDAERTMRTCLAVSSTLSKKHVDEERIKNSKWLFIEGYLFANPEFGQSAVAEAVKFARAHGTKIAVTCSESFIVDVFGDALRETLKYTSFLFCNETEAKSLSKESDAKSAFNKLKSQFESLVVTAGADGAYLWHEGNAVHVKAIPCKPKDLTGAGDMFAGTVLYGLTQNIPLETTGDAAAFLTHKVIMQVGARLPHGTKEYWSEFMSQ